MSQPKTPTPVPTKENYFTLQFVWEDETYELEFYFTSNSHMSDLRQTVQLDRDNGLIDGNWYLIDEDMGVFPMNIGFNPVEPGPEILTAKKVS